MLAMSERPLSAVVLAAGAGTRMKSARPKPLHLLCGRPMVVHVLEALQDLDVDWAVMVVGHGAERVVKTLNDGAPASLPLHYVEQTVQRGTGDAVQIALSALPANVSDDVEDADMLVLPGDTPLLESSTVAALLQKHRDSGAAATILTVEPPDPTGYGRVVRDKHGRVRSIVEQRDATEAEAAINEVNTSVYCFRTSLLGVALRRITDSNDQGELYLTDVIQILAEAGHLIETMVAPDVAWAVGVNDRSQLATAEAELRRRINEKWMMAGVTMIDPLQTYIDVNVKLAPDVTLAPGVRLQGATSIGTGSEIGPGTHLVDCFVGERVVISGTQGRDASVGDDARVGPYVVLRPGAEVVSGETVAPFTTRE
jgi:bifunctional UDP-N-acetylglucosamine pyrophosphorylase/glucosamine-1-phosphate N-acetyltransferase